MSEERKNYVTKITPEFETNQARPLIYSVGISDSDKKVKSYRPYHIWHRSK